MSVPFPTSDPQPFAPLGVPLPSSSSPGYGYLPVPSPAPQSGRRSRTHSGSSAHHHSSSHGHHHHGEHHHRSHSRSHSHDRHGRSHSRSRSRSRHHSHSGPAPPILVTHHSDPWPYQISQPALYPSQQQAYPSQPQPYASQPPAYAPQPQAYPYAPSYAGYAPSHAYAPAPAPYAPSTSSYAAPPIAYSQAQVPYQPGLDMPAPVTRPRGPPRHERYTEPLLSQEVTGGRRHKHSFMHPLFKYSRCTGKKKAVCIGINYSGAEELQGCVNDAKNMYHFLNQHHGYHKHDILYLVDTSPDPRQQPTRKNIIAAMKWLVKDAKQDDALFIHYSGHGGQVPDQDHDEADGLDEVIFPVDYKKAGVILDDEMHAIMVHPLPPGCRLTGLFDSCHSGSILDVPYLYDSNGRIKGSDVAPAFRESRMSPADVIVWSGSTDAQTSADTYQGGLAVGAMSYAFMKVLKRNPNISYQDLLRGVREVLKTKYSQKPQLSSSHRIDTNLRFVI